MEKREFKLIFPGKQKKKKKNLVKSFVLDKVNIAEGVLHFITNTKVKFLKLSSWFFFLKLQHTLGFFLNWKMWGVYNAD